MLPDEGEPNALRDGMSYLGELKANIRPLAAASLGSGTSLSLFSYTNSVFAPHLVKEFGWSRSQFALVGLTMLTTLFLLPLIGRFTDRLGVRRVAMVGTILVPLCFVGYSMQQGSFAYFLLISTAVLACGSLTSTLVYTRLIAENFERATGLALTIVNCTPAVLAMLVVPLLNEAIESFGWRVSYLGVGAMALAGGIAALALTPRHVGPGREPPPGQNEPDLPDGPELHLPRKGDYPVILRSKTFWIIIVGMFLCLLQTPLHASQMNLMLVDNAITPQQAANIVSIYAFGTIVGRVGCGLALDRFSTPIVTGLSMVLPAIGFFVLGTDLNGVAVIAAAMFLVGLSVGAESDLISYLVARYFKLRIYNTTLSLLFCASFLASAVGAGLISLTLKLADSFSPFLFLVSGSVAFGGLLFFFLPRSRAAPKIG
jgi:MFS family permease